MIKLLIIFVPKSKMTTKHHWHDDHSTDTKFFWDGR